MVKFGETHEGEVRLVYSTQPSVAQKHRHREERKGHEEEGFEEVHEENGDLQLHHSTAKKVLTCLRQLQ